ncbi:MAG: hypothetical protein KA144_02205 [Xanthomonadaceae bacterium]|nr:hypothetical protein [Xanthomonadaceae bacterium]MBP7622444.1 hypothetical protein [Xanthomonadales bacterium]
MPSTILDCVNKALVKIGADRISSGEFASPSNKNSREASAIYLSVLDAELRKNTWRFATFRSSLPVSGLTPALGYTSAYEFPTSIVVLRLIQVGEHYPGAEIVDYVTGDDAPYAYENGVISTNDAGPIRVKYVSRISNIALIDPFDDSLFVEAYACKLAMELAEVITASDAKRERASREYRDAIMEAVRTNAIEAPPNKVADDTWILSRL